MRPILRLCSAVSLVLLATIGPAHALIDADADGFPQSGDCNDVDPQIWTTPGEALQLLFAADKATLSWTAPGGIGGVGSSIRYDTLRSTSPSNFATAPTSQCFDPDGLTTSSTDSAIPAVGTAFFYLVRAKNDCGDATIGSMTGGTVRPAMTCDCSVLCNDANPCTRDRCADGVCAHDTIAPVIQLQPASAAACPGDATAFAIRASGQGTLHYQWKKGAVNVGTDSSTLALSAAGTDNGAQLTCLVTDSCSATPSAAATLTVFASAASCSGGGSGLEAPNGASLGFYQDRYAREAFFELNPDLGDVYLFSGEFYLEVTDLLIAGRGFDFEWSRKYRSREGRLTNMGQGWDFSYNRSVASGAGGSLVVSDGNSRRDTYMTGTGSCWTATGFFRELCLQVDNSYLLTFPNKTTWKFAALDGSPAQGKIVRVQDSNANTMTFAYDGAGKLTTITDTLGRPITVSYNAEGYVSAVTDFGGRQVSYGYASVIDPDGSPGDLRTVTSPFVTGTVTGNDFPTGKTTTYTYSKGTLQAALDHNLLTITDPTGSVVLRNVYTPETNPASPRFDRLDRQVLPSGTMDYAYIAQTPGGGEDAVTKTCVKDKAGNVTETSFDAANRLVKVREFTGRAPNLALPTDDTSNRPVGQLRPTDPAFFETHFTWSSNSLMLTATLPEGDSVANTYDFANPNVRLRANLLQSVRSPGPRGADQPSISESWGYTTTLGSEPCPCKGCCGEGGGSAIPTAQTPRSLVRHARRLTYEPGVHADRPEEGRLAKWINKTWHKDPIRKNSMGFWTSYTNGLGRTATRSIDSVTGNLIQVTAPLVTTGVLGGGSQTIAESWEYNAFGQITRHIDPTGQNDTYAYHASGPQTGYLASTTADAPGSLPGSHFSLLTLTARDAYGNLTALTDPGGHTQTFTYNQLDQLVRQTSSAPFNHRTDRYYDAADRIVSADVQNVDENGVVENNDATSTLYYYDASGWLVRQRVEPDSIVIDTEYQYDANGHVTLKRQPEAVNGHQPTNVVRSLYDERDLLFRRTLAESDPQAATTQWDYDKNGNTTAIRAGLQATPQVLSSGYDGYDRMTNTTDPMGNLTIFQYDANGNATFVHMEGELIDGESGPNVRLYEASSTYDEVDRLVRTDAAFFDTVSGVPIGDGFATTKTFYDASSRTIRAEDDNAHGTTFTYDSAGRLATTTDAAGNTHTNAYDANSNTLTATDVEVSDLGGPPQTFVTTYTYDNLDRRSSTTDPGGNEQHDLYDSRNNVKAHFDARGNQTLYSYDAANRLTATARKMTDTGTGAGNVTFVLDGTRSHDDESRLVSQTDDNGNTTAYQYDALNRVVATLYPDGTTETTSYDVHGNAIQIVDANGSVTTATFDADDRLKTRSVSRAAGVLGTATETWKYDGASRVVHAANDGSVVTRKYDSLSNVIQETLQVGAGPTRALTAGYDGAGNRTSMVYPSGVTVTATRDTLDRAKTITTTGPKVCFNGPTPGILCTTSPICGAGGSCQPLPAATMSYYYAGPDRVIRRKCCGAAPNEQLDVLYDSDRRITRTTHARLTPGTLVDDRTYGWDATDNKTSRTQLISAGTGRSDTFSYDSASRLIQSVEAPTSLPPVTIDFSLDGVGNRTTVAGGAEAGAYTMSVTLPEPADRELNQYTSTPFDGVRDYDRNGNLIHKSGTGETLSYDYRNRMVQVAGGAVTHIYSYDAFGRRISADGSQYFSVDNDTIELTVSGTFKSAYVYGDHVDDVVMGAQDVDGNLGPDRVAYHADDMGNVMAVTNGFGAVLESYDYDNYGRPRFFTPAGALIAQTAIGNALLFNGHRYDAETGLYDYRTRYLDPKAGRFNSRDSIGTWGDEGNLGNGNAYAGNNPWSQLDPTGDAACGYWKTIPCPPQTPQPDCTIWVPCVRGRGMPMTDWLSGMAPSGGGGDDPLVAKPKPRKPKPGPRMTLTEQGRLYDDWGPLGMAPGKDGGGSSEMKAGTVKFFNETKGFGFSKLCPGHPSCPPQGIPEGDGSAAMSMGYDGPSLGGSDGGPEYSMIPWKGFYCINSGIVYTGICCDSNCDWCSIWGGPSENCCSHVAQGCWGGFGTVSPE